MASRFGGKQESDMLEKLGTKYQQTPDVPWRTLVGLVDVWHPQKEICIN